MGGKSILYSDFTFLCNTHVMRFSNAAGQPAKLGTELGKQEAPDMGDSSL